MSGSFEKGTGALLTYLAKTATANSEEDLEGLLGLLQPADSEETAGKNLTKALGYNPITFYDGRSLSELIDDIVEYDGNPDDTLSDNAKQQIRVNREVILEDVMLRWPNLKAEAIKNALVEYLRNCINDEEADKVARHLGVNYQSIVDEIDEDDPFGDDDDDVEFGDDEDDIPDGGLMDDE